MPLLDDNFQNWCPILWYHFSDVDASVSLIHPPYATINSIYCGVGYLNKRYWSSDIPKKGSQNSTSICQKFWKISHRHYSCKIALRMMPIGKLFHIISYISYLSLLRPGIDLSFCISTLIEYTTRKGSIVVVVPPQNFHSGSNFAATTYSASLVFALLCSSSIVVGGGVAVE